jgi:outer membrane protein TolC
MRKLFFKILFVFVFVFVCSNPVRGTLRDDFSLPLEIPQGERDSKENSEFLNSISPNKPELNKNFVNKKPVRPEGFFPKNRLEGSHERKPTSPKTLTLEQAINLAYKKKPSIQALRQAKEVSIISRRSTMSPYLPQVSATGIQYDSDYSIKRSAAIGITQLVYSFAGPQDTYRIAQKNVNKAEHAIEQSKDDIRLAIEKEFLNAWLLQQKENAITKLYNSSKETFEKDKHKYELKMLNQNDWLKANATFAQNIATVQSYQDDISISEQTLEYLIGEKHIINNLADNKQEVTKLTWDENYMPTLKPVEFYYELALRNRKDLKIKDETIKQKSIESNYYLKKYLPSISLFGNFTRYEAASSYNSHNAGLKISWSIFDGLTNYFNKEAAKGNQIKTELEKQDLQQSIKVEIQTAYSNLMKYIKQLNSDLVSYKQSENEFNLKKQKLSLGQVSETDFKTAEYTWNNVQYKFSEEKVAAILKERTLIHACGYPE